MAAAVALYRHFDFGWGRFALLLLAPDLFMLGYLVDTRVGAALYNAVHTYLAPALVGALLFFSGRALHADLLLIWVAHIGLDRLAGYGLKYGISFKESHLDRV